MFTVYLGDGADPFLSAGILGQAASIGVKVGVDAEMTPRQPLNTIVGYGSTGPGVVGGSTTNPGVAGYSDSGSGVYGASNSVLGSGEVYGYSQAGFGVTGRTTNVFGAGVLAQGASDAGIALKILTGGIQVAGAGISTTTPVCGRSPFRRTLRLLTRPSSVTR